MYIKRMQIGKYRHIESIEFGPFRPPAKLSDLVVLAGPNGGGKTSVLELVSLALSNMWSLAYQLNRTAPQSSFEVTIGLLPSELKLIEAAKDRAYSTPEAAAMEYLTLHRSYCRSFSFSGGEYEKDPALHNTMHGVVQGALRGSLIRPLGFFLGSDRSYLKQAFVREKIFSYSTYASRQHTWSYAFQTAAKQYEDMFDFLVTWRYHYARRLGSWYLKKAAGAVSAEASPPPDEYGDVLARVFPEYRFVESEDDAPTDLFVRIPSGEVVSFSDLSSGEKEVFFTLCFFQRHSVEEAVVLIDEPELHLHPSLSRLLLRTMQSLKPRNQIWLATQSSDVIDESGRDRVFFVRRGADRKAQVIPATEEQEVLSCLRDFFGYTGYLGLARAMVFTEGRNSSADRKLFSRLIPTGDREIKFIPANGSSEIERINRALLAILEADVGWCRFFLIRDRDFLTDSAVQAIRSKAVDRLFVLDRHELENYLLVPAVISRTLESLFDKPMSPDQVLAELRTSGYRIAGNALRDMVAYRLNYRFRPADFSVPKLMNNEVLLSESGWDSPKLQQLKADLQGRATMVEESLGTMLATQNFELTFQESLAGIETALAGDDWVRVLPGKELLQDFASRMGLGRVTTLQNALINELAVSPDEVPTDLSTTLATIGTEAAAAAV